MSGKKSDELYLKLNNLLEKVEKENENEYEYTENRLEDKVEEKAD